MSEKKQTSAKTKSLKKKIKKSSKVYSAKNERISATRQAEIKRERRNYNKNIKDGISILNNKLENFDCAIITSINSKLSDDDNVKRFTKLRFQAIDRGFLDFLIKADSKDPDVTPNEIKNSIQCLVDFRGFETLEECITTWGKEYNQISVLFLPKDRNAVEIKSIGDKILKKELLEFNKLKVCEDFIGKLLRRPFKFKDSIIVEFRQPTNIMGRWYINSLLKNM
jgi:hypothetical protein